MKSNSKKSAMSQQAREELRQYQKEWRAKNKDKVRAKQLRYWEKRARLAQEARAKENREDDNED